MTQELQSITDDELNKLDDALMTEQLRREHLSDDDKAHRLAALSDDDLRDLHDRVDGEVEVRVERSMATHLAHEIEQGEAREAESKDDTRTRFLLRVARMFKLVRLNAPDAILSHALGLVNKSARELEL